MDVLQTGEGTRRMASPSPFFWLLPPCVYVIHNNNSDSKQYTLVSKILIIICCKLVSPTLPTPRPRGRSTTGWRGWSGNSTHHLHLPKTRCVIGCDAASSICMYPDKQMHDPFYIFLVCFIILCSLGVWIFTNISLSVVVVRLASREEMTKEGEKQPHNGGRGHR